MDRVGASLLAMTNSTATPAALCHCEPVMSTGAATHVVVLYRTPMDRLVAALLATTKPRSREHPSRFEYSRRTDEARLRIRQTQDGSNGGVAPLLNPVGPNQYKNSLLERLYVGGEGFEPPTPCL